MTPWEFVLTVEVPPDVVFCFDLHPIFEFDLDFVFDWLEPCVFDDPCVFECEFELESVLEMLLPTLPPNSIPRKLPPALAEAESSFVTLFDVSDESVDSLDCVFDCSKPSVLAVSVPWVSQFSLEPISELSRDVVRPFSVESVTARAFSHEFATEFSTVLERSEPCVNISSMPLVWVFEREPPNDFDSVNSDEVVSESESSVETVSVVVSSWVSVFVSENS